MTHRDSRRRGTLILDRVVPGVGRIKRASGTTDKTTFKRLNQMLDQLVARGRLDLLVSLRDQVVTPLVLWDAFRRNDLDRLPSAETVVPLRTQPATDGAPARVGAVDTWLEKWTKSVHHKRGTESAFAQLAKLDATASVGDLPALLTKYRDACIAADTGRSFNLAKSAAQAFVRDTLTRAHWLYKALTALQTLPVDTARGHPFTRVTDFEALCAALRARGTERQRTDGEDFGPIHETIARTMVTTGMHAEELWGVWEPRVARVEIAGTKTEGRGRRDPRKVPLVMAPVIPPCHRRTFENAIRDAAGKARTVYDLRRTYAHWMEEAGIPRTRRKLYLGHSAGDITDRYEAHEVDAYLVRDGATLRTWLREHGWGGPLMED